MEEFLHLLDEDRIVAAIGEAESKSTGEIRVHVEKRCSQNIMDRAVEVFASLHMHQTNYRNGVLIYVACQDHQFAIIGDAGINAKVGQGFWEQERQILSEHFKRSDFTNGICEAINKVSQVLRQHFPPEPGDTNELSDDISYGE